MPDRYNYPGTHTARNKFGVTDLAAANELEAAAYTNRRSQPVPNFTPDLAGLKAIHRHLFQDIYEWAGKTRAERVTIDGETFTPRPHHMTKGDVVFDRSTKINDLLTFKISMARATMDDLRGRGQLTKEAWASLTADQIGTINKAHPFREGNGRTMRRFIELSAEHYGFQARVIGGPHWMIASHNAMHLDLREGLRELITYNTKTAAEAEKDQQSSKGPGKEGTMAETPIPKNEPRAETLRRAAAANSAAAEAVSQIKDPQRRADAQQLLDGMRTIEAKQRSQTQSRSPDKPKAQSPRSSRDRGQDLDR